MTKFDEITDKFDAVKYMRAKQAVALRELISAEDVRNVLEVGFYKGKSSAYIGAILEDRDPNRTQGGRLVTIDRANALERTPNIHDLLEQAGLAHRVEPRFAFRSFTWELQKLIAQEPRPRFDLCYFDGGHTWDDTGFGVLLVDMLLKPGGLLLLDDVDWSISRSEYYRKNPKLASAFSVDEAAAPAVRQVWNLILPHLGYSHVREYSDLGWALARKGP
jgi:predicted O-methyltransferase YrrM